MDRELARVEEPADLDPGERRLEQAAVLLDRVLAQMPGVVGLVGALGGERQPVGRRDERERSRLADRGEQRGDVLDVLDRLQEDDGVERPADVLDEIALEAEVGPLVAGLGVLVGLRVGVDPDDVGGTSCEDVGAVPLTAGEVGDAACPRPGSRSTRRRPDGA